MNKQKLALYFVLLIIILASINSSIICRVKLYKSDETLGFIGYGKEDVGYLMKIILTNDNLMLVEVLDINTSEPFGIIVFKVSGVAADHLFGPIYRLGTSLWSFRYFPDAKSVWKVNLELVESASDSGDNILLSQISKSNQTVLIFRENELQIWNDQILGSNDQNLGKYELDYIDKETIDVVREIISGK